MARAIETLRETPIAEIQRRGFHFQARDYYSALNDIAFLEENHDLWHHRPLPRGVDWDLEAQLRAVRRIAPYTHELRDVPQDMPPGPPRYHWRNDFWSGLDALVQYGLLRDAKPSRVVEIGCGWSSLLMAAALTRNEAEGAAATIVDQIEPYARKELLSALPAHWALHETILQRAPMEPFEALGDGDVCFYDGSHVARAGSDVVWFFSEVIPRLAPGVIVHLHDIFWPSDYPDPWIFERGQTWNEQYVLQAFLMYNREFEPLLSNSAVLSAFPAEMEELLGSLPTVLNGGSFWMRRRSAVARETETATGAASEETAVGAPPERAPSGLLLRDAPAVTIKRRDPASAGAFLREFAGKTEAARGPATEEGINTLDWYHTIALPDGTVTRGMFDHRDLLPHYGIPEDLSGRRVLDVATSSGFWAFEFERRGGDVTATDVPSQQWDWPAKAGTPERDAPADEAAPRSPNFELAARALGSRVELRSLSVYDLSPSEVGKFDFVHTADLLVHLERPLEALRRIRSVVADDGTFLLADAVDPETLGDTPLTWYVGGWQNVEWWVPSVTTLAQMVHDAGFADVEILRLYNLPAWDDERGFWRAIIRARP